MRIVDTAPYTKETPGYADWQRDCIYCGIDSSITLEIFQRLWDLADSSARKTYEFETRQSIIAAIVSDRGIRIDEVERIKLLFDFENEYSGLAKYTAELGEAIGISDLNPRSPIQLMRAFYEILQVPVQYKKERYGERRPTVDEEALGKISQYLYARPLAKAVLSVREIAGDLKIIKSSVDSDGRMRAEFETGSVVTARWASRKNPLGGGTNFQNIPDRMRRIFIPDDGYVLAYLDLEQAESRSTAYYADDEAYIKACEAADLHTAVSQKMWPGVDTKSIYHKHLSHRDVAKKAGHATNNGGTPYGIARKIMVDVSIMERFHKEYFAAFPGIKRHHRRVEQILQSEFCYTTVFGRRRYFFGRSWDHETLKDAVSHINQATIGDLLGHGLDDIFWKYDRNDEDADVKIVAQVHDAGLFLVRETRLDLLPILAKTMEIPVPFPSGKTMIVPVKIKVGYNWGEEGDDNPNGLGSIGDLRNKKLTLGTLG